MAESRCREWVECIAFALPLFLGVIILCIFFFGQLNDGDPCVKPKALRGKFRAVGICACVMGVVGPIAFLIAKCSPNVDFGFLAYAMAFILFIFTAIPAVTGLKITGSHAKLLHEVCGAGEWDPIIACLAPSIGCDRLNQTNYASPQQLFSAHLNPLQSGCCMPPLKCGLSFVSPTYWAAPTSINQTSSSYVDGDCTIWNNDPTQLCYSCDSCKEGLLAKTKKKWRIPFIVLCAFYCIIVVMNCRNYAYLSKSVLARKEGRTRIGRLLSISQIRPGTP